MKQAILISTGLLLTTPFIHAEKNKDKKPNVVFILADDLGYGDLSCYGQEKFETPNIDKLAQSGMRFTQCYSGTTVSAPSRSCLLTGTHSGHTPVRGNLELDPEGQFPLPDDARTIFEVMKDASKKTVDAIAALVICSFIMRLCPFTRNFGSFIGNPIALSSSFVTV